MLMYVSLAKLALRLVHNIDNWISSLSLSRPVWGGSCIRSHGVVFFLSWLHCRHLSWPPLSLESRLVKFYKYWRFIIMQVLIHDNLVLKDFISYRASRLIICLLRARTQWGKMPKSAYYSRTVFAMKCPLNSGIWNLLVFVYWTSNSYLKHLKDVQVYL